MRYAMEHPHDVTPKVNMAYNMVRKRFNYAAISELFDNMIREVYG
jgi:hypothetical protein